MRSGCATRALTRARRVGLRGRANTTLFACCQQGHLHRFGAGHLTGLEGGEAGGLYAGLAGGFAGLHGPETGLAEALRAVRLWARRGRACDACFHCTNAQYWAGIQYRGYALSVWLSVWHSPCRACAKRMA